MGESKCNIQLFFQNTRESSAWFGTPVLDYISGPEVAPVGYQHSYYYYPERTPGSGSGASYSLFVEPDDGVNIYSFYEGAGITFDYPDNYRVTAEATNTCGTSSTYLDVYIYDWPYYTLSPNPASEEVTVTVNNNKSDEAEKSADPVYVVSIYNMYGVLQQESRNSGESFTIPVNSLKDGNYIVKIRNGTNISSHKLIIKR